MQRAANTARVDDDRERCQRHRRAQRGNAPIGVATPVATPATTTAINCKPSDMDRALCKNRAEGR
jgi:hypothetical protein